MSVMLSCSCACTPGPLVSVFQVSQVLLLHFTHDDDEHLRMTKAITGPCLKASEDCEIYHSKHLSIKCPPPLPLYLPGHHLPSLSSFCFLQVRRQQLCDSDVCSSCWVLWSPIKPTIWFQTGTLWETQKSPSQTWNSACAELLPDTAGFLFCPKRFADYFFFSNFI